MWSKFLSERWFFLPALSGVLMVLAFHPFDIWPLAFVAFVPLYYFVYEYPGRPWSQVFWGGFITESIFALSLSYFTVIQFHWLPDTYLFTNIVHFLFLPLALLGGLLGGLKMLLFRALRSGRLILDSLLFAATYTIGEIGLYALCGGYYLAMLAYAATPLAPLLIFASVGGAFFVSFIVALVNGSGAVALAAGRTRVTEAALTAALFLGCLCVLYLSIVLSQKPTVSIGHYTVALVQVASRDAVGFGSAADDTFVFPTLAKRLSEAGEGSPDLLIYPFSPVEGAVYEGPKVNFNKRILVSSGPTLRSFVGRWVASSTTVMFWTTGYASSTFSNEFQFVKGGALVSLYRKRAVFPFIDYTPAWAARLGFYSTQIDMTPGSSDQTITLGNLPVGALLCSEVHRQSLAQQESGRSSLIISAGSEAIFVDDVASVYSLKAAQFRAAENNIPVIRANIIGPSGIIDSRGTLIAEGKRGYEGVIRGSIDLKAPNPTIFSRYGNIPIMLLLEGIFAVAVIEARRRHGVWIRH